MSKLDKLSAKYAAGGKVGDAVAALLHVIDSHTGEVAGGPYASYRTAIRARDKLDNDYGAVRYRVRNTPIAAPTMSAVPEPQLNDPEALKAISDSLQGHAAGGPVGEPAATPAQPQDLPTGGIPSTMADHLSSAISSASPETSPILKAHALALLRANLNAAHAIHTLTGDPSAYGHYQQGARALSQALGGNNDSITAQMIAQQGTGDMNPMALAPAAITAANLAVPQKQS